MWLVWSALKIGWLLWSLVCYGVTGYLLIAAVCMSHMVLFGEDYPADLVWTARFGAWFEREVDRHVESGLSRQTAKDLAVADLILYGLMLPIIYLFELLLWCLLRPDGQQMDGGE